eukprot:363079-Chlamydomonas_euryale.AAC.3
MQETNPRSLDQQIAMLTTSPEAEINPPPRRATVLAQGPDSAILCRRESCPHSLRATYTLAARRWPAPPRCSSCQAGMQTGITAEPPSSIPLTFSGGSTTSGGPCSWAARRESVRHRAANELRCDAHSIAVLVRVHASVVGIIEARVGADGQVHDLLPAALGGRQDPRSTAHQAPTAGCTAGRGRALRTVEL